MLRNGWVSFSWYQPFGQCALGSVKTILLSVTNSILSVVCCWQPPMYAHLPCAHTLTKMCEQCTQCCVTWPQNGIFFSPIYGHSWALCRADDYAVQLRFLTSPLLIWWFCVFFFFFTPSPPPSSHLHLSELEWKPCVFTDSADAPQCLVRQWSCARVISAAFTLQRPKRPHGKESLPLSQWICPQGEIER